MRKKSIERRSCAGFEARDETRVGLPPRRGVVVGLMMTMR